MSALPVIISLMLAACMLTLFLFLGANTFSGVIRSLCDKDRDMKFTLEWDGPFDFERSFGRQRVISSWIYFGGTSGSFEFDSTLEHTFESTIGPNANHSSLLTNIGLYVTQRESETSRLKHQLAFQPYSKGAIYFRDRIVTINGRVRIRFSNGTERVALQRIITTQTDERGNMIAEFGVKYEGTDRFKHPDFESLSYRTLDGLYNSEFMENVTSARACAEIAESKLKDIAVYLKDTMQCRFVESTRSNPKARISNSWGAHIGSYDLLDRQYDVNKTQDQEVRERWIFERKCDIIEDIDDSHVCRVYPYDAYATLMFRRFDDRAHHSTEAPSESENGTGIKPISGPDSGGENDLGSKLMDTMRLAK